MKTFLILLALSLFSSAVYAQWVLHTPPPTDKMLFSVYFPEPETGYVSGREGVLFKTEDSGTNWTALVSGTSMDITSIHFINASTGLVACASPDGGRILKTTDGGVSWISKFHSTSNWINDMFFVDDTVGYAVGNNFSYSPVILKTTDGGDTWNLSLSPITDGLYSCFFTEPNTGFAVGSNGKVLKTVDGGLSWIVSSPTWQSFYDVYFTNQTTGYIVGTIGCIMKSTDAGASWNILPSGTTKDLLAVVFTSENNGYIVGANGTILMTNDAGQHWKSSLSGTNLNLHDVFFSDAITGYAVGANGTILKTTNAGALGTHEKDVSKGIVSVFPNPATGIINIELNNLINTDVQVRILNLNGKLMWQNAFYSRDLIEIDISFLPKGVYLLKTITVNNIESRKLIVE